MINRRELLAASTALAAIDGSAIAASAAKVGRGELCSKVDVFVGTGGHGHTFPGPALPFGMVQLGPDTDNARWDACSGYHHDDTTILGFSHTHLSGTGGRDMMDVLVVPAVGPVVLDPGTVHRPEGSYRQRFDHAEERATPGYYRVRLKESGIEAELTATLRAGLHRYHFPRGEGHLLIDFHHGAKDKDDGFTGITEASLRLVAPDLLVGSRRVHSWADGRQVHFAMRLSRPCAGADFFANDRPLQPSGQGVSGANLKVALRYPDAGAAPLLVKVGISGVDQQGAIRNVDTEMPGWDFEGVREAARMAWERELSCIRIEGATPAQEKIFYSALYHTMLAPTVFSDVDGRYRGMDTAVRVLPKGQENYSTYSLWDTYRALHPMFSLVRPERNADFARGLVFMTEESPFGPPIWPLQGIETQCMIGWHSVVVIAEAVAKKTPGVDAKRAWAAIRPRAFQDRLFGLEDYRSLGFLAADREDQSVSKTLEYSYDDWAMARIAEAAGAADDAAKLRARSRNYANVFDRSQTFMRPRLANGQWAEPFDPRGFGHNTRKWNDFTESNSWQATFLNQHDLGHYMTLFGGEKPFEEKLDALFAADSALPADAPPDVAGMVGQYAHGNEPSHHIAYLYAYSGSPWKTQARVRSLLDTQYRAEPDGLAGNEDCGQMSAWYLMSALGLYAVDPVSANYVFGSPLFPRASLDVGGGRSLSIETRGNGPGNVYVQKVTWNGRPWTKSWIAHEELAGGGRLVFEMGSKPNKAFGASPADRPPTLA
jgi:predicted alpha-1,2-mannosidase